MKAIAKTIYKHIVELPDLALLIVIAFEIFVSGVICLGERQRAVLILRGIGGRLI